MLSAVKYSLSAAAVLAFNSGRLFAAETAAGWPEFRTITLEAIRAVDVPAAVTGAAPKVTAPTTAFNTFSLAVTYPAGTQTPIKAEDKAQAITVTAGRKGYGVYAASITVSGATDSFTVLKLDRSSYLVRGGEVNLTAVLDGMGRYYDVSGTIPLPGSNTLKLRLAVNPDGTLTAENPAYKLTLSRDRAAGAIDPKIFSKADAACIIALGIAISSDRLAQDPAWIPPATPGPWVRVPYRPGVNGKNPWYLQAKSGGGGGGGGGGAAKGAKGKKSSAAGGGFGGGRSGGRSFGGGGGGSFGGRGGSRGGEARGGGRGKAFNSGSGGMRPAGGGRGAYYGEGGGPGGRGAAAPKKATGANKPKGGGAAKSAKRPVPAKGPAGGGRQNNLAARRPADSRATGHNVANSVGSGGRRPFVEPKPQAPRPAAKKPAPKTAAAKKTRPAYSAGAFAGKNLRAPGSAPAVITAAAPALPPSDLRDSLRDAPARHAPARASAAPREENVAAGIKAIVTTGRRAIETVTVTVAAAINTWRASASTVWSWMRSLI
jgi:hypothetical protein